MSVSCFTLHNQTQNGANFFFLSFFNKISFSLALKNNKVVSCKGYIDWYLPFLVISTHPTPTRGWGILSNGSRPTQRIDLGGEARGWRERAHLSLSLSLTLPLFSTFLSFTLSYRMLVSERGLTCTHVCTDTNVPNLCCDCVALQMGEREDHWWGVPDSPTHNRNGCALSGVSWYYQTTFSHKKQELHIYLFPFDENDLTW